MADRHERAREHLRRVLLRRREHRRPRPCTLPLLQQLNELTCHEPTRALTVEEMRHFCAFCAFQVNRPRAMEALLCDQPGARAATRLVHNLTVEALHNARLYLRRRYGAEGEAVYRNVAEAAALEVYSLGPQSARRCFLSRHAAEADLVSLHLPRLGGEPGDEAVFTLDRRFGALLSAMHFATTFQRRACDVMWDWSEQHRGALPEDETAAVEWDCVAQHAELLGAPALRLLQWFNESRGLLQWLLMQ